MCGRYTITVLLNELRERFGFDTDLESLVPRYNVAPTQDAPVIVSDGGRSLLTMMRWGLVPSWAKDPAIGNRLINARAETVDQKPSFRSAFRTRRCLVPADGFYEWKKEPDSQKKTPMRITLETGEPFAFAGLWEVWQKPEGGPLRTFTILTTAANDLVKPIHDRMPVILEPDRENSWLDPDADDPKELLSLLGPYPPEEMKTYPVSTIVNSPANDVPACIKEASEGVEDD